MMVGNGLWRGRATGEMRSNRHKREKETSVRFVVPAANPQTHVKVRPGRAEAQRHAEMGTLVPS